MIQTRTMLNVADKNGDSNVMYIKVTDSKRNSYANIWIEIKLR
jgi:ribosomal protein L14